MIWIEKGFVVVCWRDFFFIIILSQLTAVDLRGGEALGVPKAVSPPRAPPLRPRGTGCCPRCGQSACCGQAAVGSRFRRAFAEGEQPVSLPLATDGQTVTIFQGFRLENLFRLPIGLHQLNFHTPQLPGFRPEVPHVRHSVFID